MGGSLTYSMLIILCRTVLHQLSLPARGCNGLASTRLLKVIICNIIISSLIIIMLLIFVEYNTNWICKEKDSFVSCGMNFIYEDQKLYVPVCGIYKIYSQIEFKNDSSNSTVVHHKVEVNRNCTNSRDNTAEFDSYAGLVPIAVSRATTVNLATVKMCAGGSVSVVIPSDSACCAYGRKGSTYFSIQLTSQVDCDNI